MGLFDGITTDATTESMINRMKDEVVHDHLFEEKYMEVMSDARMICLIEVANGSDKFKALDPAAQQLKCIKEISELLPLFSFDVVASHKGTNYLA